MKIKIDKTKIKKILDKIQGLTNQKTSLNITKNVLIKTVDDNFVSFSATDLTGEFYCIEEAEIENNGEIAINSKKLFEIVKNYPDEYVSIEETDPQWIKIGDNDLNYNLVGAVADDFPKIKANPHLSVIGHITKPEEGVHIITRANQKIPLKARGWSAIPEDQD